MTDALAYVSRWLSAFKDDPVPFVALVLISLGIAWWLKGAIDKGKIDGLEQRVKLSAERLSYAQEKERDLGNIRLQLQTEIDQLTRQIVQRVPSLEVAATIGSVQSSLVRLDAVNQDISDAIKNTIVSLGGTGRFKVIPTTLPSST
jgi:hypothetical protein